MTGNALLPPPTRRSSIPLWRATPHHDAPRRSSTSCSSYGSPKVLPRAASRASMGGTLKPKHIGRTSLSRADGRMLGDTYLHSSRPKTPSPMPAPTQCACPILHYLRSQTPKPPNVASALRGVHAKSFDSSTDTGRCFRVGADHLMTPAGHPHTMQDMLNYNKVRASIDAAFKKIDSDGNGIIDKDEIGLLLADIVPQGLEHPVDDIDAIFGELDTDRSGGIGPEEFRQFLEETLAVAEERCVPMDLQTLVCTAFKDALHRVKRERNAVLRSFLEASAVFKCNESGASQVEQSSRVFVLYNRLLAIHVDASLLPAGQRGRLSFLTASLKEVLSLAEEVLAPLPADPAEAAAARRSRDESSKLIVEALMGKRKPEPGEAPCSLCCMLQFVQEWLAKLQKTELEDAGFGQLAAGWNAVRRTLTSRSLSIKMGGQAGQELRKQMQRDRKAMSLDLEGFDLAG